MRQSNDFCYREVRVNVRRKFPVPCYVDLGNGIVTKNGHVSLYAITEDMAKKIRLSGSVKGWMPIHYSSVCWIDVDSIEAGDEVEKRCRELKFRFARYFSGNKGWHFAIKRIAEPDAELFGKDRVFVRKHFRDLACFQYFDLSIYHPLHLLRGVGCIHEKTRYRKEFVSGSRGTNIPDVREYVVDSITKYTAIYYQQFYGANAWNAVRNLCCLHNGPPPGGSRYQTIWRLSKDLFRQGLSTTQVMAFVEVYNGSFENPHEHQEVERAVRDAARAIEQELGTVLNPSGDRSRLT